MRFLLYKDGNPTALQYVEPTGNVAEFPICNVTWRDAGSYRCCYHSKMYQFLRSHPSDPVELVVAECSPMGPWVLEAEGLGQQTTNQLLTVLTSWCCFPGGSEPSAAPVLTCPIIAGVSVVAASLFLLLFLLAFLCYRRTRGNALMGEQKQLDVLSQESDPSADGLTYAELDHQALQAKQGGPAPAPEPILYAAINVSRGSDGQSRPPAHTCSVNQGEVIGEMG
nr:leukocyte immunoglobulin-like receptor subfamily B member 1 [Chelonoidis abingdonii]